ncbi:hypothetical protein, conserved [Trypanosoma brucei gambiense DAL972]|uniref:RanBP2-type domain-containing protein n=1 Tax=Trypanosoma brucei gambiense (strain MHOM/CI/86/DAL972) TaxID=679716 RepID=C9ZX32_TRYB9|nr:hypothetical protein, conserved [Trypanosoma brucei gambiense DAL972]CBH13973.1 hypothetical protein, conserved [Trypanosoma brucei gambiense DAL972]|eukprot:XP_011776247.1 hypothetical protein, conserved [Trypanosoma brucei gambiense DAL972]
MITAQQTGELPEQTQGRFVCHRLTSGEVIDFPIADMMSIPLDRLCQLAWPLLQFGLDASLRARPLKVPCVSQSDNDDMQLARVIYDTVAEIVRTVRPEFCWDQVTCHWLRASLFQKALQSIRERAAVVPQEQCLENPTLPSSQLEVQSSSVCNERRAPGSGEAMNQKTQRRLSESTFICEDVPLGEAMVSPERRGFAPLSWVVPYLKGRQDERWLQGRIREMVDVVASPQNDGQKQLVSTAASLSGQALHHKRSAVAFLGILREVLDRWNESSKTPGENDIFGFNVVLPILHITRFTKLDEADTAAVAHILERVRGPPRPCGSNRGSLSTATFVTKYVLSLEVGPRNESTSVSPSNTQLGEGRLPVGLDEPSTIRTSAAETELPKVQAGSLELNPPASELAKTTEVFLVAPLARKVTVHVRKALNCDDVQIALIPHASLGGGSTGDDAGETGRSTNVVWFEPVEEATHELIGGCSCVLRYRRGYEGARVPMLEAEVRLEMCVEVNGRWAEEFRAALSSAQLEIATHLLQQIKCPPVATNLREESIMLFSNGLQPRMETRELPPLLKEIAKMDDGALRRRVSCRQSDVRGVRAALCMIGSIIAEREPDQVTWGSWVWQDVVKRVSLASSVIGGNPDATDVAAFASEHASSCKLSTTQIVEGTVALLSSTATVAQLRDYLSTQSERARTCIRALLLLLRAEESFVPQDMFRVVSLLRDLMMYESDHYLMRFSGCGEVLTEQIRVLVHRLFTAVFAALQHVMSMPEGEQRRLGPHRFLWDTDKFGPFALISLSLLATPLDERDLDFIWHKIISQVEGLLPSFTDFARTASFKVDEVEENSVIESVRALIGDCDAHRHGGQTGDRVQCDGGNDGGTFVGLTMVGASERGLAVWVPSGREPACSTSTPLYFPSIQLSSLSSTTVSISSTLPSSVLSSPRQPPLVSSSNAASSMLYAADINLTAMPSKELIVALASGQHPGVTSNIVEGDPLGFYFEPHSGKLRHANRVFSLPPLSRGDRVTFCFPFSPKTSTRAVCLLVNGVCFASFPAPPRALYLLVGVTDSLSLEGKAVRISFRSDELSVLGSIDATVAASLVGKGDASICSDCLPTRHFISMFATLVFAYLISLCTRRFAQAHRSVSGVSSPPTSSSLQVKNRTASGRRHIHSEEAWRGFIDGCCCRLRQNVESLIDSIKHLSLLDDVNDATERVKRSAASFVYHRFLMDYITIMRTAIYCSSHPADILTTLTKVVCCEEAGERARCAALTTIHVVLQEPGRNFDITTYNPIPLWDCCCQLSRQVTAPVYKPFFTTTSAATDLRVVSGGRHVKSLTAEECSSRGVQNTTSFASQGIPLDGSLGDVVSFSVRVRRGFEFDSLGRLYYVGVACHDSLPTSTELEQHPGTRQDMKHVYAITDYFADIEAPSARVELFRHSKHWMLKKDGIIFGSGDIITVTVDTKARCISFGRNELPLGTLYTNIPSAVKVVFPFVEMYNKDATSSWMYMPCETGIRARLVMRAMLSCWDSVLVPLLSQMLRQDEIVALQVLGADGDEMSFTYTGPPRGEIKGSFDVRLVRQKGSLAEIVLGEGGSGSITVPAVAIEPNYESVVSGDLPLGLLANEIMGVLSRSISFTTDEHNNEIVHIHSTKTFICALRLLSELDMGEVTLWDKETQRLLLSQFIRILAMPDTVHPNGSQILLEAWNELMLLPDNDKLCMTISNKKDIDDNVYSECGEGGSDDGNARADEHAGEAEKIVYLRCPVCDEEWGHCAGEGHAAPYSLCVTLHHVMQRLGLPSPFVGFACEWLLVEEGVCVTLRVTAGNEVEGEGADTHGPFSFSGKYVSSHHLRGRCVYKCMERPNNVNRAEEEWTCAVCTFINLSDSTRCAMCTTARPGATWTCMLCSYAFNSNHNKVCTTCGNMRLGLGSTDASTVGDNKQAFCTQCGKMREYISFIQFESRYLCEQCQKETLWLPEEKHVGVAEAKLVGAGDRMSWFVSFGCEKQSYTDMKSTAYSFRKMLDAVLAVSPQAGDLTRYVPPLMHSSDDDGEAESGCLSLKVNPIQEQKQDGRGYRAVIPAIIYFCSRIVCSWGPNLAPKGLAKFSVLCRLRVLEDTWLTQLRKVTTDAAQSIFTSCLQILLSGKRSEQMVWSLSSIARVLMNCNTPFQKQRHYLLYALSLNAVRGGGDRTFREVCYAALNLLLEEASGQKLNVQCLREVITMVPVVANQRQLMVHASLRGVNASISADVTLTSWLIEVGERMERSQRLPALFDEPSPDTFPYVVELPDTRMGSGGELIVGQVRGSVGVLGNKGGRYYYEVVLPPNFDERGKTIVMGWGTIQHEVVSSGQHVGSDIHSWGFNCQDRLRIMTGEQALVTPRPIVGGDIIGTLLDLDTMMMCWSVNGEELTWIAVSTQGKGEAIYPYVSAAMDPHGVLVRLSYTQFKPEGYKDFSPGCGEEGGRLESSVKPQCFDFYVQLCDLVNDVVNCGFTVDSLAETDTWMEGGREALRNYPLLSSEVGGGSLYKLKPYLQHLRSINSLAVSVAKSHNIFRNSQFLMRNYEKVRRLLFFAARWAIVERQIDRRLLRNNVKRHRHVLIDLKEAKGVLEHGETLDFITLFDKSVTGQLFHQTHDADIYRDAVMFTTRLSGEVADDAGGVTRSVVSMMCDELQYREDEGGRRMEPLLPFFKLSSHSTMVTLVPNIDFYRSNPNHRQLFLQFFTWFGKLIGNITLSGYVMLSITLPRLVWMFLTFDEATVKDYYADIDDSVRGALEDDDFLLNDEFYYSIPVIEWGLVCAASDTVGALRSKRSLAPAFPKGCFSEGAVVTSQGLCKSIEVERRRTEVGRALVHQYDELLSAMRLGVTSVVPSHSLQLIRWDDLQQRVCGSPCATAEDVMSSLDVSLLTKAVCDMLVEVVRGMSNRQRAMFLLFCSGQRRVPLPEKVQVSCGDDPAAVPTAHTCSPISLLLQPYSSAATMREKLEVSLHHMYEFGFV